MIGMNIFSNKHIAALLVVICLSWSSCIEEIDLTVPGDLTDSLAIQGRIEKGETSSKVTLSVSNVFDFTSESRNSIAIREAFVVDESGTRLELERTDVTSYERVITDDEMIVDYGRSYKIELTTLDNRSYESQFDRLVPAQVPGSLELEKVNVLVVDNLDNFVEEERIQLNISSDVDPDTEGGLLWEVEQTFKMTDSPTNPRIDMKTCYITEPVNADKVNILEPSQLAVGRVENYPLLTAEVNFKYNQGLYFNVSQYSLSPEAYEYFRQLKILTERTGNMFDDPVGEVVSNFYNVNDPSDRVYGYFFATEGEVIRLKVPVSITGELTDYCPPPVNNPRPDGSCPYGICCDCLAEPESTLIIPEYWEE